MLISKIFTIRIRSFLPSSSELIKQIKGFVCLNPLTHVTYIQIAYIYLHICRPMMDVLTLLDFFLIA